MKKYILILLILLCNYKSFSQNKISVSPGFGYYISNSENSMKVMGGKRIHSFASFSIAYQREQLFGYNILFEYNYHESVRKGTLLFVMTSLESPEPIGYFGADVSLINHNFNIDYVGKIDQYFSYGFGPSILIVNRIIEVDKAGLYDNSDFYDKLASTCLGINGYLDFSVPITGGDKYFFFNSKFKLEYAHSVYFDKGIRNLDDYYQQFLITQLELGIGYSF